jgi:hypothetical protein
MRPRPSFLSLIVAAALLAALAGPAGAHELTVKKPKSGDVVRVQWIGGDTVPEPARDAPPIFGPAWLPPSHGTGLPHACMNAANSPAIHIAAPPDFADCFHGP